MPFLHRRQGAAQVAGGVAFCAAGGDGVAETWPQFCMARCAVSSAPRLSMRRSAVSNSGAVIEAMGRAPSQGNTSRSMRRRILLEWLSTQFCENFAYHSRAMVSKLFAACSTRALLACWRCSLGSMPLASRRRASSRFRRASFSETSG